MDSYLAEKNTHQIVVLPDETDGERLMSVADLATKYGCRLLLYNNRPAFLTTDWHLWRNRETLPLLNEPCKVHLIE